MLLTPSHGSFPAGHSTQCHFLMTILAKLARATPGSEVGRLLRRLADRIGENRVIAGVHYEPDIIAGAKLGDSLGEYFIASAQTPRSALNWLWKKASAEWPS